MGLAGAGVLRRSACCAGPFHAPRAFILSGQMAVAYFMVHAPNGFWPLQNKATWHAMEFRVPVPAVAGGGSGAWIAHGGGRARMM